MQAADFREEISRIRQVLSEISCQSHTSDKFQNDILGFIEANASEGSLIIEIGCYKGGLTAQLAYAAKRFGLSFDVIDIDHHYLNVAAGAVEKAGLGGYATFHAMDFAGYVRNAVDRGRAVLVFDDGDHRYNGVMSDIAAIKAMKPAPYACAFHDFSLRYDCESLSDVRVDRAIHDGFGGDVALQPIGEIAAAGGPLRTEPGADHHFHELGKPEGVILTL